MLDGDLFIKRHFIKSCAGRGYKTSLEIINHDHNNLSVAANFIEQRKNTQNIYVYGIYLDMIQMYVFNIPMSLIF